MHKVVYPFAAILGQDKLKLSLILNAINPAIGGVLIRGEKGTAKSTSVRALGALLPEIEVFKGCLFNYGPDDRHADCSGCMLCSHPLISVRRKVQIVTLPLNATEDRVAGGIDFNLAVKKGARVLQPGILAKAHRGILYVDEVNLLDDHLVDIILDASASGINVIEREGISFTHASRVILVGTMNPEEGELRPQLLDRFGLCVDVESEKDLKIRADLMHRRELFDADPELFIEQCRGDNEKIGCQIREAREHIGSVTISDHSRSLISKICSENNVAGHRADLVLEQAAKTFAALQKHQEVTHDDILEVVDLVLSHRKREAMPPPPPHDHNHQHDNPDDEDKENRQENNEDNKGEKPPDNQEGQDSQSEDELPPEDEKGQEETDTEENPADQRENVLERIFDVGETFKVKKFSSPKDRVFRRGSGRRSRSRISQKQGRYVKSTMSRESNDIALDATLRAAAPFQLKRSNSHNLSVVINNEDIRGKIREKRIGNFLLFIVDASGSMGARGRMKASKGAIMSLLLDAYQKRDRIAMISFRRDEATVNLPVTSSIELAANMLKEMPVGGRTPLSAGLAKSYEMLRYYLLREPTARPIAIIITDGKSNMSMGERKPFDEAMLFAERLSMDDRIRFIVVDTESQGLIKFGLAHKLSHALNAMYFKIDSLKADSLLNIVKGQI